MWLEGRERARREAETLQESWASGAVGYRAGLALGPCVPRPASEDPLVMKGPQLPSPVVH